MATVTTPGRRSTSLAESHRKCRHPLERLRGYIRFYVCIEGLTVCLIYLALWFWIGLLVDYGIFKVFEVDWVQEDTTGWGRTIVLILLTVGLVAVVAGKVVFRLLTEFRDDALALVLERRFPEQLGDRLITAVELADLKKAAKLGYSEAMIEQTIHDAAERVEPLPVQEVFNWKRLRRQGLLVAFLTLGLYLLAGVCVTVGDMMDDAWFTRNQEPDLGVSAGNYFWGFPEVASTWFERNILLRNIIWPRRAHLEILDFDGDELKIGRNAEPPNIRVRALKWVIADAQAREGWRALRWSDLRSQPLGVEVPDWEAPSAWKLRDPAHGISLDEIDLQVEEAEKRLEAEDAYDKMDTEEYLDLLNLVTTLKPVLNQLSTQAAKSSNKRLLRKLKVPASVVVKYKGKEGRGDMKLEKQKGNEYIGQFREEALKESITFRAYGEDYATPPKRITVVQPPSLDELATDQYRPAYLYYRTPRGIAAAQMKGKKQLVENIRFSMLGGDKTTIDVPVGTDVVLTAKASKPLASVRFAPPARPEAAVPREEITLLQEDSSSFRVRFDHVNVRMDFAFEFTDTDGVTGQRKVEIKPILDAAPEVSVVVNDNMIARADELHVRQTGQGRYLCTVSALLPLRGNNISDDHGLENLEYGFTLSRLESGVGELGTRSLLMLSAMYLMTGGPNSDLLTATQIVPLARKGKREEEKVEYRPVATFARSLQNHDRLIELLPPDIHRWGERLAKDPPSSEKALLKSFKLEPEKDATFDVEKLNLKVALVTELQPRYLLTLWLEATDNDIETGPHRGKSKETYTFLLVSENQLMTEIVKDEDTQYLKFAGMVNNLELSNRKLLDVNKDLTAADLEAEQFRKMSDRIQLDILQILEQSRDTTEEVKSKYQLLLAEMETNRVKFDEINNRRKNILRPLEEVLSKEFEQAKKALSDYRAALDFEDDNTARKTKTAQAAGDEAKRRMEALIKTLRSLQENMQGIADLTKLVEDMKKIAQDQQRQAETLKKIHDELEKYLIDKLLGGEKPKEEEKPKKEEKKP